MRVALLAVLLLALAGCANKPDISAKTVQYQADYPQYQTLAELFAAADLVAEVELGASAEVREQAIPGFTEDPIRTETYRAGFDAFWEVDLFGRVRAAIKAAETNAQTFEAVDLLPGIVKR